MAEAPQKPSAEPREGVDYEPDTPDRRGQYLSAWDIILSVYYFIAGAVTITEFDNEDDQDSWQLPVIGVVLCLLGILLFVDATLFTHKIDRWFPFLNSFFGRGGFHIVVGALSVNEDFGVFQWLPIVPIATGVIYLLVSCISKTMIPLPLFRSRKAVDNHEESHPGYKEELARHNKKKCQKKWDKEYKKQLKEYKKTVESQDKQHNQNNDAGNNQNVVTEQEMDQA